MTTEQTSNSTETEVAQAPVTTTKPYDDEMLESYAETAETEVKAEELPAKSQEVQPAKEKDPETEAPEPEEGAKSKEGDKVDDGFEKVVIKRRVNGKDVEFTVEDAIQAKLGQEEFNRNMDRRSTAQSQKEKRWNESVDRFRGNVGKLVEVAQKGDFVTAIRGIAKIATNGTGLDQVKFEEAYFQQLDKVHEVYSKMSEPERKAWFAERRAAVAEEEAKGLREEKATHVEISQLQSHVHSLQKQYGIANPEFWGNYKYLIDNVVGDGKIFKDESEVTAEHVVEYTYQVRHERKIEEAAKKAGITNEEHIDAISKAILASDPSMSIDEIANWIVSTGQTKTASPEQVENLNRKAGTSRFNQGSSTKKENGIPEGYDQETLDELYRRQPKVIKRPVR